MTDNTMVPVPETGTALATTNAEWDAAKQSLMARIPADLKPSLLSLTKPTNDEIAQIHANLPADIKTKLETLLAKLNPVKRGFHTSQNGFTPTDIKVYHGVGADPMRPKNCIPGSFYTSESKIIMGYGDPPLEAAVLTLYEGRTLWPPKESDSGSKAPICISMDRKMGSRYGSCAACPKANEKTSDGGCTLETVVFLVDRDLTGIYIMRFSKSSFGAGNAIKRIIQKANPIYDRWFKFETVERTGEGQTSSYRWFVIQAGPVNDVKNPKNNTVDPALYPLFDAFTRTVEADRFFPEVARIYDTVANGGTATATAETFDGAALADGTKRDYSKDPENM